MRRQLWFLSIWGIFYPFCNFIWNKQKKGKIVHVQHNQPKKQMFICCLLCIINNVFLLNVEYIGRDLRYLNTVLKQ